MEAVRFYLRLGVFSFLEQFSNFLSGLTGFLLFPFFMYILATIWQRFNGSLGNFSFQEIVAYVGLTEILFMTFLRTVVFTRASQDFSLSLARPRSWVISQASIFFGKAFGNRLSYLIFYVPVVILFGVGWEAGLLFCLRFILLLPLLGIIQALYNLLFASGQLLWAQTSYMTLPISKIFLVFGGVFSPLVDYSEPYRGVLLNLPPSDIFFQPAYFCIRGEFYQMTSLMWVERVLIHIALLCLLNFIFYRRARRFHMAYGG